VGWAEIGPTKLALLGGGPDQPNHLGWAGADPAHPKVYYMQNVNYSSRSACSRNGCRNGGRRSSGSLDKGVSAVIRRLSWWFWWQIWEERWPESITGEGRRILQRWERGRNGDCFKRGGGWLVVGLATCGGAGGSSGWWLEQQGERGKRENSLQKRKREKQRGVAGFLSNLDPILSSLRPSNPPLFIGGRRW